MKKRLAVIILLAIICCGALSLTADASTPTTVTELMDSLKQSVTEAVYNVDLNAPFSKETSGVREDVSTETGGMLVSNTLLSIPGRNGMDLNLSLVYNNQSAKLYDEGTGSAAVSNSYGTVIAFYDVFDSNGYWLKTGALQYTSSDSTILGSTTIDGDSWVFTGYLQSGTSLLKTSAIANTTRARSAAEASRDSFGIGWSLDLPSIMVDEDTVYVTLPDGQTYKSDPASASGLEDYKLSDISFAADTSESNGSDSSAYRMRYADGSIDYYTQQGEILRQTDRFGNTITYYYTEADGLRRLTKIIDTADRVVTFSYNDTATTIRYDSRSITLQKTQVSGVTGKYVLSAYVDEAGRRTTYAYSYDSATFDLLGKTAATNTYANLMEIRYPTDLKTCYAYTTSAKNLADGHMQYCKVSRRWDQYEGVRYNLQKYFYRNEPDGYPLYKSDEIDEFYTYGSNVVNEDGTTIRYIYNFKHLLQSTATVSDDGTEIQRIKYDVNRNVPVFVETSVKTDSSFVKSIDTYSYDIRGNLIKENHPVEPEDLSSEEYATAYTYDSLYNLMLTKTYKQDKDTTITVQYTLSEDRMNSIAEDIFSNGDRLQSTTYDYDSCGNLIESAVKMDENEWAVTRYEYGSGYRYVYPTAVTAVDVEDADGGRHNVTQRYTYDLYTGDVLTSTDGNGYTTGYTYDNLGRVLRETLPDGLKRSYTYDDRRNTVVGTDANGNSFVYTYDAFGHLSNVKDKETGAVLTAKEYDNRENVSAETDGNGSRTEYTYDTRNRLTTTTVYGSTGKAVSKTRVSYHENYTDAYGNTYLLITTTRKGDVTDLVTNYYYDGRERLVRQGRVSDSGEEFSTYRYDYLDNAVSQTGYDGAVTTHTYNALGQVLSVTNANGETTGYAYDGMGNVTATTNALGDTTHTRYDALGRLIKQDSP